MASARERRETYLEAWPQELFDISMPSAEIELSEEDLLSIGSATPGFRADFDIGRVLPISPSLKAKIADCLDEFPMGVFARLGTCSFKRSLALQFPLRTADSIISEMTAANDRVAGALRNALRGNYPQSLFLREWRNIPAWSEFRVFVRERKVLGISQYYHNRYFQEIEPSLASIRTALVTGIRSLLDATSLSSIAADLYVDGRGTESLPVLIEINPFDAKTDACLFSWRNGGDFDRRLRFRGSRSEILGIDISSMC